MATGARKKGISVRMNVDDLEKLKRIAGRLSARDSDVIRYAVKAMLNRLDPLARDDSNSCDLLPVFIEHGAELTKAFDLSPDGLEHIFDSSGDDCKVSRKDIELLMMSGGTDNYQKMKMQEAVDPDGQAKDYNQLLKEYLYKKYLAETTRSSAEITDLRIA